VAAQERAELSGATEWIGDHLAAGEGERRVDAPIAFGEKMGSGRERSGVEPGEPHQRVGVGRCRHAERDRALPGGRAVGITPPILIAVPNRHDGEYRADFAICPRRCCHQINLELR